MTASNASTTAASNWLPAPRRSSASAASVRHRRAPRAVREHRVEGVADRDDARAERDVLAGQAVGVPAAVEALAAGAHERRHGLEAAGAQEDALGDDRVVAHVVALLGGQLAGLAQQRVGEGELAQPAELRGEADVRALERAEAHALGDGLGQLGGAQGVVAGQRQRVGQGGGRRGVARLGVGGAAGEVGARVGQAQGLGGARRLARDGHAPDRGGDREAVALLAQRGGHAALERVDREHVVGGQGAEGGAAGAVGGRLVAHRAAQLVGEAHEERVAGAVAEGGVVGGEAVEAGEQKGGGTAAGQAGIEVGAKARAPGQPGHGIGLGRGSAPRAQRVVRAGQQRRGDEGEQEESEERDDGHDHLSALQRAGLQRDAPAWSASNTTASSATTTSASNCVPALARSSSAASSADRALR